MKRAFTCVTTFVVALLAPLGHAQGAWKETVLLGPYSGSGSTFAGLISDSAGNLYGTTLGTVFRLAPPVAPKAAWTLTVLHSFRGGEDGMGANSTLVMDKAGNLYGTTIYWSDNVPGTAFKLSPPAVGRTVWTKTVIHRFTRTEMYGPFGGLTMDETGNLYGTATSCFSGCGHIYKLAPSPAGKALWTETILYNGSLLAYPQVPYGTVAVDASGNIYSTTQTGGAGTGCGSYGCGTVLRLTPPASGRGAWTETVLYSFAGGSDGAGPQPGIVIDRRGDLYGATAAGGTGDCLYQIFEGCGTVFRLSPPTKGRTAWTEAVLYRFPADTPDPAGGLTIGRTGKLYGTTTVPAGTSTPGIVYQLAPLAAGNTNWTGTVLHSFSTAEGIAPQAPLLLDASDRVYGVTSSGTAFELSP